MRPGIGVDIFTQGKTLEEFAANIREAVDLHFADDWKKERPSVSSQYPGLRSIMMSRLDESVVEEYPPDADLTDELLSDEEIEDMKASTDDIRAGRVKTLKTVRGELHI